MRHVTTATFKEVLEAEKGNSSVDFINVCTPAEYKEKHIHSVRNVPLDALAEHVGEFKDKKTIYVHCLSGNRSKRAIDTLHTLGVTAELVNVEGGLTAWSEAGFSTKSLTERLPIMRQVFIVAGTLIVTGVAMSAFVHEAWLLLSLGVGLGLTFAGITGWCGMSYLLAKMPWNK